MASILSRPQCVKVVRQSHMWSRVPDRENLVSIFIGHRSNAGLQFCCCCIEQKSSCRWNETPYGVTDMKFSDPITAITISSYLKDPQSLLCEDETFFSTQNVEAGNQTSSEERIEQFGGKERYPRVALFEKWKICWLESIYRFRSEPFTD